MRLRGVAGDHHVRRHVALDDRAAGQERVRADLHELVHRCQAAEDHPVADFDMPAKRGAVGEHGLAANDAVMCDM